MSNHRRIASLIRYGLVLILTLGVTVTIAHQERAATAEGHVIAGRIVDPHQLRPEDAVLMLWRQNNGGSSGVPIPIGPDGSFVTPPLSTGTYILEVVRTPHSPTKRATVVGSTIVSVATSDVSGVMITVRRDTAITGRFRMESDNPKAAWPPHIAVGAYLALDGKPLLNGIGADGAPDGKFVLRNTFGPRVLRCGYTLAPGNPWWPSRVILDGRDITNVPTDFSELEDGSLEVVFTQHPARIAGTVTDAQGQAVSAAWIMVMSADRALWQRWASTSDVTQADADGRFSIAVLPGQYLVAAVSGTTFDSRRTALENVQRFASHGVEVEVADRKTQTITLSLQSRSR